MGRARTKAQGSNLSAVKPQVSYGSSLCLRRHIRKKRWQISNFTYLQLGLKSQKHPCLKQCFTHKQHTQPSQIMPWPFKTIATTNKKVFSDLCYINKEMAALNHVSCKTVEQTFSQLYTRCPQPLRHFLGCLSWALSSNLDTSFLLTLILGVTRYQLRQFALCYTYEKPGQPRLPASARHSNSIRRQGWTLKPNGGALRNRANSLFPSNK